MIPHSIRQKDDRRTYDHGFTFFDVGTVKTVKLLSQCCCVNQPEPERKNHSFGAQVRNWTSTQTTRRRPRTTTKSLFTSTVSALSNVAEETTHASEDKCFQMLLNISVLSVTFALDVASSNSSRVRQQREQRVERCTRELRDRSSKTCKGTHRGK